MKDTLTVRTHKELGDNYREISRLAKISPVSVTYNGKQDTVIMGYKQYCEQLIAFNRLKAEAEIFRALAQGEDDIKNRRVCPLSFAKKAIMDKYSL